MTINAVQKTPNFFEYGVKAKIPYCARCKSFEGVTVRKESGGLTKFYKCPQCGLEERYDHKCEGHRCFA